jgi:hypothetical protein
LLLLSGCRVKKKRDKFQALLEEEENQIRGFTYIFDCSGLTLSHLAIWTPSGPAIK